MEILKGQRNFINDDDNLKKYYNDKKSNIFILLIYSKYYSFIYASF